MKFCILIIYSYSDYYNEMKKALTEYYSDCGVCFYFIDFREDQTKEIEIEDHTIYVKGENSFIKITEKSMKAMKYMYSRHSFDYMIRSNISTVINIQNLNRFLDNLPSTDVYCGGPKYNLQWSNEKDGVSIEKHGGTLFVQGSSIILSKDIVKKMVACIDMMDYTVIDDVSIALFLKEHCPQVLQKSFDNHPAEFIYIQGLYNQPFTNNNIFYRSVLDDRTIDVYNIQLLCNNLPR